MRIRWIFVILVVVAGRATAQDMPLTQVLIAGEGWRPVEPNEAPPFPAPTRATTRQGFSYAVDSAGKAFQVTLGPSATAKTVSIDSLNQPTCLALWPDGGHLVVGCAHDKDLWAFRVEANGNLGPGDRYYALRVATGEKSVGVSALTFDTAGRLYAATDLGVQVFDPTGRLCGVLLKPAELPLTGVAFGGTDRDRLFIRCGDRVYGRKTLAKGLP